MSASPLIVLGSSGQVGAALVAQLQTAGRAVVPVARHQVDLSAAGVADSFSSFLNDAAALHFQSTPVVVNLAAWTAVDDAETEANRATVTAINATAPGELAKACQGRDIPFIHVSTDYVFGGDGQQVGKTVKGLASDTKTHPVNHYGATKADGERRVLAAGGSVVRTAWVFSGRTGPGRDFVDTMAELAERGMDPSVVNDQWGRPTFAADLATGLIGMADAIAQGHDIPHILHATGSGDPITWFDFARAIFDATGHDPARVSPISTAEYPTPAARPRNLYLDISGWQEAGLDPLPAWEDGLRRALG